MIKMRKTNEEKNAAYFLKFIAAWILLTATELAFGFQFEVFKHEFSALFFSIVAGFIICIVIAFQRFYWRRIVLAEHRTSVKWVKRAYSVIFGILLVSVHFFYFSNIFDFVAALLVAILASFTLNWITER